MNFDSTVTEKFLRYIKINTKSDEESGTHPSSKCQFDLARLLKQEIEAMDIKGAEIYFDEEHCYLYLKVPKTAGAEPNGPKIGFIAHLDTSPEASGENVNPQITENYDGGDIGHLSPDTFPELKLYKGQTLITTDGTTLLGSDDKSGVAEIMTMLDFFAQNPNEEHGEIRVAFTPDEEIGEGTEFFDIDRFDADFAYTIDGGILGELSYENFNAATATVTINGVQVHPGEAYGKMINAIRLGNEFDTLIPGDMRPETTKGHEGFFHLMDMKGDTSEATLRYLIRDHSRDLFESKKSMLQIAAYIINKKYQDAEVTVEIKDSYYNMEEKIRPQMDIVDRAAECMRKLDIEPKFLPIRGGTDGAMLSYKGLPCPNICAGGHNFHGIYEFVSVQSMGKISELLILIAR